MKMDAGGIFLQQPLAVTAGNKYNVLRLSV